MAVDSPAFISKLTALKVLRDSSGAVGYLKETFLKLILLTSLKEFYTPGLSAILDLRSMTS